MSGKKITCLDCGQVNRVPADRLGAGPKCGTCGAALMPARAVEVDAATLEKAARTDDVPLVVDFWAPWCGPCKMMAPFFERAAQAFHGRAILAKLDTDGAPASAQAHGIRSIPTLIVFDRGRECARQAGALDASRLRTFIEQALARGAAA
jgi:thioredoxin 2